MSYNDPNLVIQVQGAAGGSGTPVPISGSISATNPSVAATGAAVPASATYVAGLGSTGNLTGLSFDASGNLKTTAGSPDVTDRVGRLLGVVASITAAVDVSDRAARLLGHVTVDSFGTGVDVTDRAARLLGHVAVDSFGTGVDVTDRAARLVGHVTADSVATGQGRTLLFASISTAASGATSLVAADGTRKIKVVSYAIVANAAVTAKFQSATTDLTGAMPLSANGGVAIAGQASSHLFETAVNSALNINLGSAVQVSGHLAYFLE